MNLFMYVRRLMVDMWPVFNTLPFCWLSVRFTNISRQPRYTHTFWNSTAIRTFTCKSEQRAIIPFFASLNISLTLYNSFYDHHFRHITYTNTELIIMVETCQKISAKLWFRESTIEILPLGTHLVKGSLQSVDTVFRSHVALFFSWGECIMRNPRSRGELGFISDAPKYAVLNLKVWHIIHRIIYRLGQDGIPERS